MKRAGEKLPRVTDGRRRWRFRAKELLHKVIVTSVGKRPIVMHRHDAEHSVPSLPPSGPGEEDQGGACPRLAEEEEKTDEDEESEDEGQR